jgi:hypothetical protein
VRSFTSPRAARVGKPEPAFYTRPCRGFAAAGFLFLASVLDPDFF